MCNKPQLIKISIDVKCLNLIGRFSYFDEKTEVVFVTPGVALRWFAENKLAGFDIVIVAVRRPEKKIPL